MIDKAYNPYGLEIFIGTLVIAFVVVAVMVALEQKSYRKAYNYNTLGKKKLNFELLPSDFEIRKVIEEHKQILITLCYALRAYVNSLTNRQLQRML